MIIEYRDWSKEKILYDHKKWLICAQYLGKTFESPLKDGTRVVCYQLIIILFIEGVTQRVLGHMGSLH